MKNCSVNKVLKNAARVLKKHAPTILTSLSVAGMFGAVVLAVKATPEAMKRIEEKKEELDTDKLSAKETVKAAWKPYIPTAAVCVAAASCGIASNAISSKRGAVLGAALTMSETALMDYQRKAVEVVGEKKEQAIRDAIAKERVQSQPANQMPQNLSTRAGDVLCYESYTGRYFRSDSEEIQKAVYKFNRDMVFEVSSSLNDFYSILNNDDLQPNDIGDDVGWNSWCGQGMEVRFSSQLTSNEEPCLVMDYYPRPRPDYTSR